MPRKDGTPTIDEMLDDDDRLPQLKVGDPVRYSLHAQWVYGSIVAVLDDYMFSVQIADGSTVEMDAGSLWCLDWPRDQDKTWPHQEDCTHCPGKAGPDGQHKFGCSLHGARSRQPVFSASVDPDGKVRVHS